MARETLKSLKEKGFDKSSTVFGLPYRFAVACSQCQALVINNVPTHETGCPNATKECRGCNARIPARFQSVYCRDCGGGE